jgi:Na+/H+ antiporter NhaD/arsenite permease-like protein
LADTEGSPAEKAGSELSVPQKKDPSNRSDGAVDLDTLTLLLGMMIVVANLRLSGFFALATA